MKNKSPSLALKPLSAYASPSSSLKASGPLVSPSGWLRNLKVEKVFKAVYDLVEPAGEPAFGGA